MKTKHHRGPLLYYDSASEAPSFIHKEQMALRSWRELAQSPRTSTKTSSCVDNSPRKCLWICLKSPLRYSDGCQTTNLSADWPRVRPGQGLHTVAISLVTWATRIDVARTFTRAARCLAVCMRCCPCQPPASTITRQLTMHACVDWCTPLSSTRRRPKLHASSLWAGLSALRAAESGL